MAVDKDKILNELNSVVSQLQAADCGCLQNVFKPQGHNHCNHHMCGHMGIGNKMKMGNPGMNMAMGNPNMQMGDGNMNMGNPGMNMGNPGMNMGNPGMNMGNPSMSMGDPGMPMSDFGMNMGNPSIQTGDPGMTINNPMNMVDQGANMGNAGMNMQNPGMTINNPMNMVDQGANMGNAGMNMQNPGMNIGNAGMNMGYPGMNMANPGMIMANPGMNMANPGMNMASPGMNMGNPGMNMGNSRMNMRGKMGNMGMPMGVNPQEMFKNTYNYLSENLMKPTIKEIQDDFRSMNANNTIVDPSMAQAMKLGAPGNAGQGGTVTANMMQGGQPGIISGQQPQSEMMGHQSGMMTGQPGMMSGQPGMMPGQPTMMAGQQDMMAGQPAMMAGQQDMMAGHPGMLAQQPGMMTGQQGMGSGHPGMMGGQTGMTQRQTDYAQDMISQNSPSPMGQKILDMWNSSGRKPPNLQLGNISNPGQVASDGQTAGQIPAQQYNGNMNQTALSQNPAIQSGNVLPIVGGHLQANSQPMQPTQNQAMAGGMGDGRMGRGMGMNTGMPNMKAGRVIPPEFAKMFPGILGPDAPFDPFEIAYNMNPANQQKSAFNYMQNMMTDGNVGGAIKRGMGVGLPGQLTQAGQPAQAGKPEMVQPGQAPASGQQQQGGQAAATPGTEGLQPNQPQTIQNLSQQQNINAPPTDQQTLNSPQNPNALQMRQPDPQVPQTMYPNEQMMQRMSVDPLMASAGGELPVVAYNPLGQPVIMEDPYKYKYQSYDDGPRPLWSETPSNAKYSTVKATASKTNLAARPSRMFTPSKMNVRGQYQQPIYGGRPTGSEGRLNFQAMQLPQPGSEGRLHYQYQQQQQQRMPPAEQVGDVQRQVEEQPIKQEPINSRGDITKDMARSKSKNGLQDTVYTRAPASSWSMGSRLVSPICR